MKTPGVAIPHELQAAADRLAEALRRAGPISAFLQIRAEFEADSIAQQLLDQLAAAQADLRLRQGDGSVTQADLERLRDLQRQAASNPVIMRYAEAQQMANGYLLVINQEISQLIGLDFGALARPAQC